MKGTRPTLLFVGAFPPAHRRIFGGNVTDCRALLESSLPGRVNLRTLDSTQHSNPAPRFPLRLALAIRRTARYWAQLLWFRPDAVLLFTGSGAGLIEKGLMAWGARLVGVASFLFPRGGLLLQKYEESSAVSPISRLSLSASTKVFCQGTRWRRLVVDALGRSASEAPIVSNWTATPALLEIGKKRPVAVERARIVRLLFVGWIVEDKGILDLIKAFGTLAYDGQLVLDIVGDGVSMVPAQRAAQRIDRQSCAGQRTVRFHGWLSGNELIERYADADVFVLPSRVEGLPNVLVEAMACKLCVVASSVGNIPDIVIDGKTGLLVSHTDSKALAMALERVIVNGSLRGKLACAGFRLAKEQFSVERAVDELVGNMFGPGV